MCLSKRLKEKDEEAYQYLLDQYGKVFVCMANNFLHNKEESVDCVQEILVRIYMNIDKCPTDDDKLIPWMFKLAKNQIIDYNRKLNKKNEFCYNNNNYIFTMPDNTADNSKSELLDELRDYLGSEDYEILTYYIVAEMTYKQIGEIMNLPSYTARRRVKEIYDKAKSFAEKKKEGYE